MKDKLTEKTMEYFTGFLCNTYRKTFDEDLISDELVKFARERGLPVSQGKIKKNVVIYKEGIGKYKDADYPVILQAHMDMVCVSSKADMNVKDVFEKGVEPYYEDENGNIIENANLEEAIKKKLRMRGKSVKYSKENVITTLGGDDGIGVAAACAILASKDIEHPPIIAVFTVEEEDGMGGVAVMTHEEITGIVPKERPKLNFNKAKFINIDDERDGIFSVSCAGSLRAAITLPVKRETAVSADAVYYTLSVSGLAGGHSGLCIHEGRANANILLFEIIQRLMYSGMTPSLVSLGKCGEASNAIPSNASAVISIPSAQNNQLDSELRLIESYLRAKYAKTDPDMRLKVNNVKDNPAVTPYTAGTLDLLLFLVRALPDGAFTWVADIDEKDPPLIETSSNLGLIKEEEKSVVITCMIRSSADKMMDKTADIIKALCVMCGAEFKEEPSSPGWAYKKDNRLRDLFLKKYNELFGKEARAVAIHAGLECGYFANILAKGGITGIDMIACGPELKDVHTVNETLYMDTVPKFMKLLVAVLGDL